MKRCLPAVILFVLVACAQAPTPGNGLQPNGASLKFGSSGDEGVFGLAEHSSGVYAVGFTTGDLDGPQLGEADAFIRKYNKRGTVLWAEQFGTAQLDFAGSVAADEHSNAYVVGGTYGSLGGPYSGAADDTFLRKYSPAGDVLWTRQFGAGFFDTLFRSKVAVSGNHVYVVGTVDPYTSDSNAFIKKFSSSGVEKWTDVFGTAGGDHVMDVAVDRRGNAYVVGYTTGSLIVPVRGTQDMFARKYTPRGTVAWTKQFDHGDTDIATGVAVTGRGVYLAGFYSPQNLANTYDTRVIKLDIFGSELWNKGFDIGANDYVYDVSANSTGVLFAGVTTTDILGSDADDGYVYKLSPSGSKVWIKQQSTSGSDSTEAILARTSRQVYAAGHTTGVLGNANRGGQDAFLRRLRDSSGATVWTHQ